MYDLLNAQTIGLSSWFGLLRHENWKAIPGAPSIEWERRGWERKLTSVGS